MPKEPLPSPPRLLVATSNRGKLREVRALLGEAGITVLSLDDFPGVPEAVEDGKTFQENAAKKAMHYHRHTGVATLADDSGLVVDTLGGAPGVHSARFAGAGGDAANNARLVALLQGIPKERRTARFRCAMALVVNRAVVATAEGTVEGTIVDQPLGSNGFGYDPHFWIPQQGATAAQLPVDVKNRISHRGQALKAILPAILQHVGGGQP